MNWKDTVPKKEKIEAIVRRTYPLFDLDDEEETLRKATLEELLEAQAEASFKAGIREVVAWINEHGKDLPAFSVLESDPSLRVSELPTKGIKLEDWQAFLKEKGIEEVA